MKPFDFVNDASQAKKNLMRGTENDELAEKSYIPYLTNMAFSMHVDSILFANDMNMFHSIPNRAQYEYFLNSLRSRKRMGGAWPKKVDNEALDAICRIYNVNRRIGREYLSLLSEEQIEMIKKEQETGGTYNGSNEGIGGD